MKKGYKAIIFDLDGTLVDTLPDSKLSFKMLLKSRGVNMKDSDITPYAGAPTKTILLALKKKYGLKETVMDLRMERRNIFFSLITKKSLIFKGVEPNIRKLSKNYKLAIATGSSFASLFQITTRELRGLFDVIVTIDDVKKGKPSPDELLLAARKLKVAPSNCLMVGDSRFDQIAAGKAKMDSIGVLTGVVSKKDLILAGAKKVLKNVNELSEIL